MAEMVNSFNRLITLTNRTLRKDKKNEWVVIHYVGAVSSAEANAKYFYKEYRGASANYFVDEKSIWQVVEDKDDAWHVGAKKYYNACRNNNSIGIELCCKNNGQWYFENETIDNAVWLTAMLMKKYNIPMSRLTTHYLTTHKRCPEPFVRDPKQWENFRERVAKLLVEEIKTEQEALDYLVEKERITNKEYWEKALQVVKNLNFLIIKWANDVKALETEK